MNNELLSELKRKLDNMIENHMFDGKDIVVFGMNRPGDETIAYLRRHNIKVNAIVDNNPSNRGGNIHGIKVFLPQEYLGEYKENVVVLIASRYYLEMCHQLEEYGYKQDIHIFQTLHMTATKHYCIDQDEFEESVDRLRNDVEILDRVSDGASIIFLCPVKANGDIYLLSSYLRQYIRKANVGSWKVAVVGKVCQNIAQLFGIENVISITQNECESLERVAALMGSGSGVMVVQPYSRQQDILNNMEGYKGLNFSDFYKVIYGLEETSQSDRIQFPDMTIEAETLLHKENLPEKKTVILAPHANSIPQFTDIFWENLADELAKREYVVCTNVSGAEQPIKGTKPIFFTFSIMKSFLEKAGNFISIRSGMCELASSIDCKKVVLYPNKAARHGNLMDLYGLKNMGLSEDTLELFMGKEDVIIETIVRYLEGREL